QKIIYLCLFVLLLISFGYVATYRRGGGDEGFYRLAAQLVARGDLPYLDFFYPQMPLLPYVYSGLELLGIMSWMNGRILAAFLTALCGICIAVLAHKRTGSLGWGLVAVL